MRPTEDVHAMLYLLRKNACEEKEECPAWGKTCTTCDGKNHFAPFCTKGGRQRKYKQVQTMECEHDEEYGEEDDDEYLLTVLTEEPEYIDSVKDKRIP